jgi:dUTP pyrophosphatase
MILTDKKIKKLQEKQPYLLEGFVEWEKQLQPAGFDLTVGEVSQFQGPGVIDFSNKDRHLPHSKKLDFQEGSLHLPKGSYKIKTNETVRIPPDVVALAFTRSSLLRMGAFTTHAVWDPGFEGKSEFLLVVENPQGMTLKKNTRVAQMVFFKAPSKPETVYFGVYKGKK